MSQTIKIASSLRRKLLSIFKLETTIIIQFMMYIMLYSSEHFNSRILILKNITYDMKLIMRIKSL